MSFSKSTLVLFVGCLLLAPSVPAGAQTSQSGAAQEMPPMPKPGPEHQMLKEDVGTWDAVVEMLAPGAPPQTSKGVEVNTLGCGGLCLITDFKGEMMPGMTFHGHGMSTWDATKKKYVGSWIDSMSSSIAQGESTWDSSTKTMTGYMEGTDMTGKTSKMKSVVEYKTPGSRVFTMYGAGPDGKEAPMMRITYTKRQ